MSWMDHQEEAHKAGGTKAEEKPRLEVHIPGAPDGVFVPVGKCQIRRKYEKERGPRLLIIIDEAAELLMPSKVKTEAGKNEDALKQEIVSIIMSLTQLGRSAGVHVVVCTQRNDASIIPGVIQSNSLSLDTPLRVMRRKISH